mmetsp:Transcript_11810/g.38796  ORF Transcript_11810/g.38796 Transcript_11810/m.38796 type:complete len:271 (+) Transcript_11810:2531-3343(+)
MRSSRTTRLVPTTSGGGAGAGSVALPKPCTPAPGPPHTVRPSFCSCASSPPAPAASFSKYGWLMTPATGTPSTHTPKRLVTAHRLPAAYSPVPSSGSMYRHTLEGSTALRCRGQSAASAARAASVCGGRTGGDGAACGGSGYAAQSADSSATTQSDGKAELSSATHISSIVRSAAVWTSATYAPERSSSPPLSTIPKFPPSATSRTISPERSARSTRKETSSGTLIVPSARPSAIARVGRKDGRPGERSRCSLRGCRLRGVAAVAGARSM